MRYRAEIDGLRAIAVVPVILGHADFKLFSGGFVGVDIFFVISGYLITGILLDELNAGKFSLVGFYERRARRIIPALSVVMAVSSILAYLLMLPDELENYGQSLVATTLFSNNLLLSLTTGYWKLASEFKPLLHTWSLGVEEQYYIVFPLLLMLSYSAFKRSTALVLSVLAAISLAASQWGSVHAPESAFYLPYTRGWELLLGSLVAFYLRETQQVSVSSSAKQWLSMAGLALLALAIFGYDASTPTPSLYTLVPTVGAALIILFAEPGTLAQRLLSSRLLVGIGLVSYSAYLWHYPLFAFTKVTSVSAPPASLLAGLCVVTFVCAALSWKFVETPFRRRDQVSRTTIFSTAAAASVLFVGIGLYFHATHGVPSRMYESSVASAADMYIGYNERVRELSKDSFVSDDKLKLLVAGNSFSRDFVNMTLETFDTKNVEIVYRDDFPTCFKSLTAPVAKTLYEQSELIVFAYGDGYDCVQQDIEQAHLDGKHLFYVGTKHFGYNLNWLVRLSAEQRRNRFNQLLPETIEMEARTRAAVPADYFISLLDPIVRDSMVPVTDAEGRLLSADRTHLTLHGARYFGAKALLNTRYGEILKATASGRALPAPVSPGAE